MVDLSDRSLTLVGTMTGVLDLSDSRTRLAESKAQHGELMSVFLGWMEGGGIGVRTIRDPRFAMYRWEVAVTTEPAKNLSLMAGQIINNVRSALEYVAFQVYLVAGGEPDGKLADKVAFPIINTAGPWNSVVKKKVPGVWPEAADLMKAAQPFAQAGDDAKVLPTLRGLGGTDKHRNLVLCATAARSANWIWPTGKGVGVDVFLYRAPGDDFDKGPVVPIRPGTSVPVARVFVYPEGVPYDDAAMLWTSGIRFEQPAPPDVDFSFRANSGSEVSLTTLSDLIDHVARIVESFADLPGPTTTTATDVGA
ncbi:uncharacterized protein RMCN_1203 [Mycolicibacterium novocastrense]|uniref:Uncharacterized protein n=2 Tax=Mycolicibacterium novocastrense TaxID=59813 RepID=A0ABQ0KF50_MYCNV|nr:uncharacterized protein RMCN_1203 [Mycolicibacterium novocastrense]